MLPQQNYYGGPPSDFQVRGRGRGNRGGRNRGFGQGYGRGGNGFNPNYSNVGYNYGGYNPGYYNLAVQNEMQAFQNQTAYGMQLPYNFYKEQSNQSQTPTGTTAFQPSNQGQWGQCFKCGYARHETINQCPAVNHTCNYCQKPGHSSHEMAEGDRLLTAVQMLVAGEIPHFLVPHSKMIKALNHVDRYLERSADHLTLVRHDFDFYYSDAPMQTYVVTGHSHGHFDAPDYLVIVLDAPATTRTLIQPFNIYELIKFPLPTPEEDRFYSLLATDIRYIGFNRDLDLIMTLVWGHNLPEPDIWLQHDLAVKFWNRANLSCAVALADGDLAEIKHWCRYGIHKNPMPSSVIHLHGNKWLLNNISVLQVHCPDTDGLLRSPTHTQYLTELQTVMTFGCHCDYIRADNFRIITDEDYCEVQEDISATVEITYSKFSLYFFIFV